MQLVVRVLVVLTALGTLSEPRTAAQTRPTPAVSLASAPRLAFPGPTDSNSPAFWLLANGTPLFHVVNSSRASTISAGAHVAALGPTRMVRYTNRINGDRWIEAVVPDVDGTLYGFYHNEPFEPCSGRPEQTAPRIGAARSTNRGLTWRDLGIILQAPASTYNCASPNRYFMGGVGDFSVMLDEEGTDLYFFFSTYHRDRSLQGVSVARMLWADRDAPRGKLSGWDSGVWRANSPGRPIMAAARSWHDPSGRVDAFWGPSVHWNYYLRMYVMLLNRASTTSFGQEGIYVAYASREGFPTEWSAPVRIMAGGRWYPQVIGLEPGAGTDKYAGARARFFVGGISEHEIVFRLPSR